MQNTFGVQKFDLASSNFIESFLWFFSVIAVNNTIFAKRNNVTLARDKMRLPTRAIQVLDKDQVPGKLFC